MDPFQCQLHHRGKDTVPELLAKHIHEKKSEGYMDTSFYRGKLLLTILFLPLLVYMLMNNMVFDVCSKLNVYKDILLQNCGI